MNGDARSTAAKIALVQARDRFIDQWCQEQQKDREALTHDDIQTLRQDPRWQTPDGIEKDHTRVDGS